MLKRVPLSLVALLALGHIAYGQNARATEGDKIAGYLHGYLARFNDRPSSLHNQFSGQFLPIPEELGNSLKAAFPRHHFYIARTSFSHWGPNDRSANILLVTEAASGEVVAHQWDLFFSGASESFYQFLGNYPPASRQEAIDKVRVLASLMVASAVKGSVGKLNRRGNTITSELLLWDEPWRTLKVNLGKDLKFGRITMINARKGDVVN